MITIFRHTQPYASMAKPLFQGDLCKVGNIRTVVLDCRAANADLMIGMAQAIQESIEETFGKSADENQAENGREL